MESALGGCPALVLVKLDNISSLAAKDLTHQHFLGGDQKLPWSNCLGFFQVSIPNLVLAVDEPYLLR